ncbi:MAG TPA: sigma-70 family RNA polymerase sigma factor [Pseudonocardia sp.]
MVLTGGQVGGLELDDRTLVVRAQEGDVRAFEVLARRHQGALYRLALRVTGDPDAAGEALREALLAAWRQLDRFPADAAFSTWMYRIVTDRCAAVLRRRPAREADPGPRAAPADSAYRDAGLDAEQAELRRAVRGLPYDQRVCWVLRELEGMADADVAEITGAGEGAVRDRVRQAWVRLAEVVVDATVRRLADEPVEPPPPVLDAVLEAVRAELRPQATLALESPLGANRLGHPAAAAVLRAVVDAVGGLRARSCRIVQEQGPAADVALTVVAPFGADLAAVAAEARRTVLAAGAQVLGVPLRRVDIEVVDLWTAP